MTEEVTHYDANVKRSEEDGKDTVLYTFTDRGTKDVCFLQIQKENVEIGGGLTVPQARIVVRGGSKSRSVAAVTFKMEKEFEKTMGTMDGMMSIYYRLRQDKDVASQYNSEIIRKFMDKYFFNNQESREALGNYIQEKENRALTKAPAHQESKKNGFNLLNLFKKRFGKGM